MREAEEDFVYTGKAFLSFLASVEGECLDSIQAELLPHKLSLDGSDSLSIVDTGLRPCSTHLDMRNYRSHRESVVVQSSTSNIYNLRDRPATSHLAHHGSTLREVQGEMRDPMAGSDSRAGDFLEASEKAIPQAIDTMDNRSSLLLSFQTRFGSLSPSLLSLDCHGSPVMKTKFTVPEEATVTHWVHSYAQLCNLYGENYERLKGIAKISDSLKNPWSRLLEENPTSKGSLTEKILKSLYSTETIKFESAIDPAKLRMARILLYHHYKQKCIDLRKDPRISSYLSQGKGIASVANDIILEEIYGCHNQSISEEARRKRLSRFTWHKRIGQRWSFVASHLGVGIILTCSHELATHV
ncbi:hypothetical protein GMOD_00002432 [Pyrenophora seminiperda CCB06]|uniref:Uncharacterized protein n=1 Tax=Pyrenophora seminiperda CCB06 TaxID=1302712 RepID=A0A3M7LXR1_9PLEO|nr:hypothetical protein GMOD_00002432 [Pyrenophora seminiperda CCB06]